MAFTNVGGYGSEFDAGEEAAETCAKRGSDGFRTRSSSAYAQHTAQVPGKRSYPEQYEKEDRKADVVQFLSMDMYSRHRKLVNDYLRFYGGKMDEFKRSSINDKTDLDVIRENHRFVWRKQDEPESDTWDVTLAKKYYDKLFKEYCVADLSRYKDNMVALRWRVKHEVISGKGQFVCGDKRCEADEELTSWEVNFAYIEQCEKRNALVKLRLCPGCSQKLNYHHKRKRSVQRKAEKKLCENDAVAETAKKASKKKRRQEKSQSEERDEDEDRASGSVDRSPQHRVKVSGSDIWSKPIEQVADKSREEEFEDYLEELFV